MLQAIERALRIDRARAHLRGQNERYVQHFLGSGEFSWKSLINFFIFGIHAIHPGIFESKGSMRVRKMNADLDKRLGQAKIPVSDTER